MSYKSLYGLRVVKGVKHARRWLQMSLSELGEKLGVDHSTVATWQSGYRDMPSDKGDRLGQLIIDRLAEKLGHATTYLLDWPELIAVVKRWDDFIQAQSPPPPLWYAPLTTDGMSLLNEPPGVHRRCRLAHGLKRLCERAGIRYRSPHKVRHSHAVFALTRSQTIADYKAVSMNLMHRDLSVTDGIYAVLAQQDVRQRIAGLARPQIELQSPGDRQSRQR